jgi:hypothetical protein
MYLAGIPEDQTTNSNINPGSAFWTALAAFVTCVIAEFVHPDPAGGTNLFDIGVYSRKIGGSTYPLGASGFEAITQLIPVAALGTTRSRKVGRGS